MDARNALSIDRLDLVVATLFLAGPAALYITGVCAPVDGGHSVGVATG